MVILTKIVDNNREKLSLVLSKEFPSLSEIAIASAYFNVHGYGAIKDSLADKPMKLLLGREPTESIKWEEEVLRELEQDEDNPQYFELLQQAIKYFEDPKREVHTVTGPFFHGKAYIGAAPSLQNVRNGVGVVGSSNFTYGGLVSNRELNMVNTDREVVQELADWFAEVWQGSRDFKDEFLSFLKNYVTTRSPYEVVAKALYETYKTSLDVSIESQKVLRTLYPHQMLTVRGALYILEKYNGVLIADATGLGKTRVMLSLIHNAIREGRRPLLIAPKSVLETTWKDEMSTTHIQVDTVTSEKLSQDPDYALERYGDRNFIVVDEAHFFREPSTIRYSALRELILRNSDTQVVLATATPVNNSLMDLYYLFSLYLKEDSIMDLYNMTLKGYFTANQKRWLEKQPIDMEQVLERFMVRHSRYLAQALDKEGRIRFPKRVLDDDPRDRYSIEIDYQKIDDILNRMRFAFYDLAVDKLGSVMRLPDGTRLPSELEEEKKQNLKKLIKTVVIINIFKRLESSVEAFRKTLESLKDYISNARRYASEQRYFIPPAMRQDPITDFDEELPTPDELFSKQKFAALREKCRMSSDEVSEFVEACRYDESVIDELLSLIPADDSKYDSFEQRILDIVRYFDDGSANGVIVFTQYVATAKYIYERLTNSIKSTFVSLATSEESFNHDGRKVDKTEVIRDFQRKGGILVSTDVLSEGQNLQNAQYVVNYDFPWNPVVLIQRVGRVDRMGSKHDLVYLVNMLPRNGDPDDPSSLEHFLRLMQKIYLRLEAIRQTVGLDASTLGEEAAPKDFGIQNAIAKGDMTALDAIARELEQFTTDPMDALAKIMEERGLEWLQSLPSGIGAYKTGAKREALFALFTDGKEHYWRLKYFDNEKETVTSTNEIVSLLMSGDVDAKGQMIRYDILIDRLKTMKEELMDELEERRKRGITLLGSVAKPSKVITQIYDELAKNCENGERLALLFKKRANSPALVKTLDDARKKGKLCEKATELLTAYEDKSDNHENPEGPIQLHRVCWCWLQSE